MSIVATRAAEGFPRRSFTVVEIRRMVEAGIIAEDENFELWMRQRGKAGSIGAPAPTDNGA